MSTKMSSVKRRLDFGASQCSLLYIPDLIPLESPPQVPRATVPENLTPRKRRKFLAKQIEVLESAFDIDEYPTRERYGALALSLGVEVKKIQTWFKNARSKKRQMIRLQKITHTEQELQRWRRRAELRRSVNATPASTNHPIQSGNSILTSTDSGLFNVPNDLVLPQQIFTDNDPTSQTAHRDVVRTNLFNSHPVQPSLQTPNYVPVTPAPRPCWGCYAPVQDFPPNMFAARDETTVPQSAGAFYSIAFKKLITPSVIFDTMVLDQRII